MEDEEPNYWVQHADRNEFRILISVNVDVTDRLALASTNLEFANADEGLSPEITLAIEFALNSAIANINVPGVQIRSSGTIVTHYDENTQYYPPITYPAFPNRRALNEQIPGPDSPPIP